MEHLLTQVAQSTPNVSDSGTVVLVDDDPLILRCLKRALESCPYHIAACSTAHEALECMAYNRVIAIVSDMSMPDMSGLDLLRTARERDADIPVVLLTGMSSFAIATEALELGAYMYLTKPIDPTALCAVVMQAAQSYRATRAAQNAGAVVPDAWS